jgi:type VI secretion system secreted protein Hcp
MALKFYVTIKGTKTANFKGESLGKGHENELEGLGFQYGVSVPRDPATGAATGKRQHGPVTMTKAWGAASPQLFQALVLNEALEVRFEFYRADRTGLEAVFQRITLGSANVVSINQHVEPNYDPGRMKYPELEEIAFVFGRIAIENLPGSTEARDDWAGPS